MSDLQISLLCIGAVVIVAVLAYNKWQDRKIALGTSESFRSTHEDVLLKSQPRPSPTSEVESIFSEIPASSDDAENISSQARIEPVMSSAAGERQTLAADEAPIDHFVEIRFDKPVIAPLILSAGDWAAFPGFCWQEFAEAAGGWVTLRPDAECRRIRAAIPLVSRQGIQPQRALEAFEAAVFSAGSTLGGTCRGGSIPDSLELARELDAFCADVDVQIAIHLASRDGDPFAGTKLRGLAEAAGMALGPEGQFQFRNDDGLVLFCLANKEPQPFLVETMRNISTRSVSLLLDVPRTPGGIASFRSMVLVAQRLSQGLNAAILDDNGKPLGDRAFDAIAAQLGTLYRDMEARKIAAGSPTALRLFS